MLFRDTSKIELSIMIIIFQRPTDQKSSYKVAMDLRQKIRLCALEIRLIISSARNEEHNQMLKRCPIQINPTPTSVFHIIPLI